MSPRPFREGIRGAGWWMKGSSQLSFKRQPPRSRSCCHVDDKAPLVDGDARSRPRAIKGRPETTSTRRFSGAFEDMSILATNPAAFRGSGSVWIWAPCRTTPQETRVARQREQSGSYNELCSAIRPVTIALRSSSTHHRLEFSKEQP